MVLHEFPRCLDVGHELGHANAKLRDVSHELYKYDNHADGYPLTAFCEEERRKEKYNLCQVTDQRGDVCDRDFRVFAPAESRGGVRIDVLQFLNYGAFRLYALDGTKALQDFGKSTEKAAVCKGHVALAFFNLLHAEGREQDGQ